MPKDKDWKHVTRSGIGGGLEVGWVGWGGVGKGGEVRGGEGRGLRDKWVLKGGLEVGSEASGFNVGIL